MDKHSDTHKYTFALKLFQSTKEDLAEGEKRTRSRVGPATEGIAAINKKSRARREALSRLNRVKNRREKSSRRLGCVANAEVPAQGVQILSSASAISAGLSATEIPQARR